MLTQKSFKDFENKCFCVWF